MKRILLFLFFITSFATYSQYTLIPDQNFEWFLIRNGYDSGNFDGKVLTSNINTITKLDFINGSQNFIASLKGIEDFTALTELIIIDGSLLTSLDVSKNTALTKLICSSNRLTSLDVSKNIALTELYCNGNFLTELDVTRNAALTLLNCSRNLLTTLDISKNFALNSVGCDYNKLTILDTSSNILLKELSCSANLLSSLNITKNILLSNFSCGSNKLTNLELAKNINLKAFSCENNNLINLDFTTNTKLEYFRGNNNSLITLDFSNNPLVYEIDCSFNRLANINISKNTVLDKLFCHFNDLTNLDTSQNFSLNYLNCEYNQIISLDVSKNDNLGLLRCNNNQLIMLDLRSPASFTWWNDYNSWLNNPNLKCINVPDAYFFGYYWNGRKDNTAYYFDGTAPKFDSSIQTICSKVNPTIQDIVVSGYNIKWFDSQVNGNELTNSTSLNEGTTYYAMNTAGTCEGPKSSVTITLKTLAAPIATSPQILCNIQNPTLSIINVTGDDLKWYRSESDINFIANTTPLVNGTTYYVTQTKNGCESSKTPILVAIQNSAKPIVSSPQTFCIQQNANLNSIAITGQNIKWYDALINGNLLTNTTLLQNGLTYFASQTINGCESERTPIVVNIQNTPVPLASNSQSFCSTQNATLNDIAITGTAIKWYSDITNGTLLPSSTSLQNGITYYATQTINGCESTNRTPVTISLINTLNATNYAETICDDLNNNFETVDLSNYNSHLISSSTETFSYYTLRNAAENQILANQITNYSNYNLRIGQNIFYVRIDSPNTCHQIVELQLTLVSKPIITIPDIVPICENNTITIDAGAGFDSYLWSNGATTQKITVANPAAFSVTVTKNYATISCSSTKNFTVKNSGKATITSIETKDWTDNDNVITVYVTGAGDFEYSIDGIHFQNSNEFLNVKSGEYTITVRDKDGCGTATDEVYLLMYPKFFTPNGDGYNDTWKIKFADAEEGLTIKIFDRYGKLIKMITDVTDGWNGTFNGAELPASDYWFVVTRANGNEYKGHFSLKR